MPLLRILLIIFIVWIAVRVMRLALHTAAARKAAMAHRGKMIACEVCGVYFPEADGVHNRGGKQTCGQHR